MGQQMLMRGEQIPHFQVRTIDGDSLSYATIWQRRNLVLVLLPPGGEGDAYAAGLSARRQDFEGHETACVITRDGVRGLRVPGVIVADRWGEIVHVATPQAVGELPAPAELLDWLSWVERRCPECEGESK